MAAPNPTTPYASASLYVGDLLPDITEALLFDYFNAVGPVASVRVCRDASTRRSLGYAYINFHRVEDAERALDTMNFSHIRGQPCRIMWSHRDPSLRKSGAGNIFVKNLEKNIDNKQLFDTFSVFGNILSCKVCMNSKRESLGYGFVHYESEEAAQNAIERVNGMMIGGNKVTVMPFKSKKERGGNDNTKFTNVFVKNLPEDATEEALKEKFSSFGAITSSHMPLNEESKPKGFAFINYDNPEDAQKAIDGMNEQEWSGKALYVGRAQKKEEREKELRERFEQLKLERQKKYAGVNLYIKNLHDTITDETLREEFSKFGSITSSKIMRDQAGKSRGFGFVCFSSPEEATKAVTEMNGRMLENKPLYVALAQRKEARRAHLEAQHAARAKMGVPQPQMYPPQGTPVFYQGIPQRMVYPPQMIARGWNPQQGGPRPQMVMRGQPVNYQLMPMANGRGGGQAGPRQGGRGQRRNQKGAPAQPGAPQGQNLKYNNARNQGGVPAQGQMAEPAALTIQALAAAPKEQQKQMIGERLFPLILEEEPELAGKITGMLLEMDNDELLILLDSQDALQEKIKEALHVLQQHEKEVAGVETQTAN